MFRLLAIALALFSAAAWGQAGGGALKRIQDSSTITLGYRDNAAPFSFRGTDGRPAGYSVELCTRIAGAIQRELKLPALKIAWVPVGPQSRLKAVKDGTIAIECGMTTVTMTRQKDVDFSNLIFVDGGNMLVREDPALRRTADLAGKKIAVQGGTTTEQTLRKVLKAQNIAAELVLVKTPAQGLALVEDGAAVAYAGDRVALLQLAKSARDPAKLQSLEQDFSYEPYALMLPRDDAALRLVVNRELARLYRTGEISEILNHWFGALGEPSLLLAALFYINSIPE